jgi:MoxR-like ATPase
MQARALTPEEYFVEFEPYYEATGDEISIFEAAYKNKLPVLLKGPTGCSKTRFMEYMAWRLKRPLCRTCMAQSIMWSLTRWASCPSKWATSTAD